MVVERDGEKVTLNDVHIPFQTKETEEGTTRLRGLQMGAEVIALGCTGLATIGIAKDLEKDLGIPVIDPVMAEGLFAYFEAVRRQG